MFCDPGRVHQLLQETDARPVPSEYGYAGDAPPSREPQAPSLKEEKRGCQLVLHTGQDTRAFPRAALVASAE